MKNRKTHLLVVALVILSLSCNLLLPNSQSHVADVNSISQSVTKLPVLDPDAPLPSPGATQLRSLPTGGADISALISDVETAEQTAMKAAIVDLRATLSSASNILDLASVAGISSFMNPSSASQSTTEGVYLVSYSQPDIIQPAEAGLSPASLIGLLSSMFTDIFSIPTAFPTHSMTQTETKGDATTTMSMEIGKSQDGSSHFGLGLQSEGTENGIAVKTDLSAVIDGQRCPTAEGQVSFSIKARIGSQTGGTGTTQDLTTFVRATVNDDAEITGTTFDVIQGTTQVKDGRQVYVETGETFTYGPNLEGGKGSNWHLNQKTDNVTQEDVNQLEPLGLRAALELGAASLVSAERTWKDGGCVKIVATSPGMVQPGSITVIPVNVISSFDGTNAPSKLKAALAGAESINPTSLAKTPGTLSYTAPGENGKSATITLTTTSKRGKAKLVLSANTGGQAFHVSGESNHVTFSGDICINNPFVIRAKFSGGGSANTTFTPDSEAGGSTSVSGGGGDCAQTGAGTFTIVTNADGSKLLKWDTTDTLTCPNVKQTESGSFDLPLIPAPDISCP